MSSANTPSTGNPAPTSPTTPNAAAPNAAPAAPAPGGPKPVIPFEDFAKVDLRVAKILHAENHPKADRLFKLQLDDGSGTPRQICAGIRDYYKAEDLVGRLIIIVANLAPRVIRGEESRGMLLAASDLPKDAAAADPNAVRKVIILKPDADIAPGSIVS
jgi:methionine--tRNA ligase beta chain